MNNVHKLQDSDPDDVKEIVEKCLDSPGYLLFVARLTPNRDENGRMVIEREYRRYHLSLEDSRESAKALTTFVENEIQELMKKFGG
jgi:hypothetical protein